MSQYGNSKNPPWARSGGGGQQVGMMNSGGNMSQMGGGGLGNNQLLQYPQAQMFQNQMGFQNQVYSNVGSMGGAVSYPTRNQLNSAAFQNSSPQNSRNSGNHGDGQNKSQRVFTGTVTKLQDNFGFVDENVFFQTSCCVKGSNPQIGDRVLVEAIFNSAMPFKWNATRIQVLPNMNQDDKQMDHHMDSGRYGGGGGGNARFSNSGKMNQMNRNKNFSNQPMRKLGMEDRKRPMKDGKGYGDKKSFVDRVRERSPARSQDGRSVGDRSRGRTPERRSPDHVRSVSRSPMRDHKRSKSPLRPAKRRRVAPRYAVVVPKHPVVSPELDASEVKRKFTNMYIPSDFMMLKSSWINSFPLDKPFSLDFPCKFHVFPKEVDPIGEKVPAEPNDVDYLFSAKVILLSSPGLEDLLSSCNDDEMEDIPVTLSKAVSVLVGTRGREPLALGGPWSPSQDGPDPETDPTVLIHTAIRNVRALTGIDLSNCTQWYRFLEIYYYRGESVHKGKTVPARVETVVLFIPDVWSCLPTRDEWTSLHESYQAQMNRKINGEEEPEEIPKEEEDVEEIEEKSTRQPTHHSLIDPKTIQMSDLKEELMARNLSPKGLKNQLIARLTKALKTEAEDEEKKKKDEKKKEEDTTEKKKKEEESKEEPKKDDPPKYADEKERQNLARKYEMPESPHVIVHPDRTAKSGRFDCSLMTLSSLLSYRPEDNKEHSYEMFLFAETFHGMLVRDFGSKILQALHEAPPKKEPVKEKKKEVKEGKEKEKDDKKKENNEVEEIEDDAASSEKDKESVKDKDEKKEEKVEEPVKMVVDQDLLFAFHYFDSTHCGYILEKDLEELLSSIGLLLSRAQIKKLIQKVAEKDSVFYKKLVEKPDPAEANTEEVSEFQSNRELMPSFEGEEMMSPSKQSTDKDASGFVSFNGKLVDIGKLLDQLRRNESSRNSTERIYEDLLQNHRRLKEQYEKTTDDVARVQDHLMKTQSSLTSANSEISSLRSKVNKYTNIVFQVKNCIEPVIRENTSSHSDKVKGGSKWDTKDIKKEPAEDSKADVKKKVEEVMEVSDSEGDTKASKDIKKKKEEKNDKAKPEKAAQESKETPKTAGTEAVKEEKAKKDEPAAKQPVAKTAEAKKPASKAAATKAAKQAAAKQAESKQASQSEKNETESTENDETEATSDAEDKGQESMDQEENSAPEETKKEAEGSDAEEEAGSEEAAAKEEVEEEVVESPKKRRKVMPTPKKATPARRAVQRS